MVLGETKVNLVLAASTLAGIINQSSNQIRRNTTLFSLAQRRSIDLYYPSYEVRALIDNFVWEHFHQQDATRDASIRLPYKAQLPRRAQRLACYTDCSLGVIIPVFTAKPLALQRHDGRKTP